MPRRIQPASRRPQAVSADTGSPSAPLPSSTPGRRPRRIILDTGAGPAPEGGPTGILVQRFLEYVRHERALADNTQEAYRRDLRDFSTWLAGRNPIALTVRDLGDYLTALNKRGLARASVARQAATLRTFYAFLQLEGVVRESPAELLTAGRRDDSIPGTLSPEQVDRLLSSPDTTTDTGRRDKALLELLYATGCRASEVSSLRLADVHLGESFCTCRGKGDKERVVPLGRRAIAALRAWIEAPRAAYASRAGTAPSWVMLSTRGNRLSRMRIWEIVRLHADQAGVPPDIGPHTLRHSFATHLVAGGVDLRHVQEMLGHASIATTQRYTHVDASRLKSVHGKFHPRR